MKTMVLIAVWAMSLSAGARDERKPPGETAEVRKFEMTAAVEAKTPGARVVEHEGKKLYLRAEPDFTSADVKRARALKDPGGSWSVMVTLNGDAKQRFFELTKKIAGKPTPLVIMADGKVLKAPRVMQAIAGGIATISSDFTEREANALARAISSK